MNNYHFYEEIGKGKHSMVYRCRKKKCVEFCAIKSVDKVSRQKVLNEVMVLNSLHHHNVLKLHTWCAACPPPAPGLRFRGAVLSPRAWAGDPSPSCWPRLHSGAGGAIRAR
jgi:hypothetical protein